ncbi:MAG: 4-(cytidine 5'-diphospho)-2-C-methyl-D-erythritol kinase [Limisphaerales bacterium]
MILERHSPCKVNLILNILGRRSDGFHELETVMMPVPLTDRLEFKRRSSGVGLTCDHPELPVDRGNLVFRAAEQFLAAARIVDGVEVRLEKRLPLAAGLGGGSANAAVTLLALNELFGGPLGSGELTALAAGLGSDVPFFLQQGPALGTGRGEQVRSLPPFQAWRGRGLILVHPGFGVPTAWAYQTLAGYPAALSGAPGRAAAWVELMEAGQGDAACRGLYNSLEAPVLPKYPLLRLFQDFFREQGALGVLMSGSGSTTFAITRDVGSAESIRDQFVGRFGTSCWTATAVL